MKNSTQNGAVQIRSAQFSAERSKRKRWHSVVTVFAAIFVFCTVYALIIPAITWDKTLICELDEHTHGDKCYENGELICKVPEHVHGDACFDAPPAEESPYHCNLIEHVHGPSCYFTDGSLRCTMTEHLHTTVCISTKSFEFDEITLQNGLRVRVTGPAESLPYPADEVTVKVNAIEDEESLRTMLGETFEQDIRIYSYMYLDISLMHGEEEFEPLGPVSVNFSSFNKIQKSDDPVYVFHKDSDSGQFDNMNAIPGDDGSLSIQTDRFSDYLVAAMAQTQQTGTFYQRVTSITNGDGANYLIVSANGGYALRSGNTNYTSVTLNQVKGNPDYFTVDGVTDEIRWKFLNNNYIQSVSNTSRYLRVNTTVSTRGERQEITKSFSNTTKTWTLANGSYYLNGSTGAFSSSNSTENTQFRDMIILKQVNTTLTIPGDIPGGESGGEGGGTGEIQPADPTPFTPSGAKHGSGLGFEDRDDIEIDYWSDPSTSDIEKNFLTSAGQRQKIALTAVSGTAGRNGQQGYENLFDGNTATKYRANPVNGQVTVTFRANEPKAVSSYTLTTADDTATTGRLPTSWTLFGSNDEVTWMMLDREINPGISPENTYPYDYVMSNPRQYRYFRIVFDAESNIQFSELELYTALPKDDDGKILTDKSVVYKADDFNAFGNYKDDEFSVTLSALAQQYELVTENKDYTPVDVVLVLDISGSMTSSVNGEKRAQTVVTATNTLIQKIMQYHPENRVGIVTFSNGSDVRLTLDRYHVGSDTTYTNNTYLTFNSTNNRITIPNTVRRDGTRTAVYSNGLTFNVDGGTYTQRGIEAGAKVFLDESNTTYTTSENEVLPRTPLMIILSDGDPTFSTPNYMDPANGPHYGSGVGTGSNNRGIHGFYTILSANYFKNIIGNHYEKQSKVYTIGMGIYADGYESAASSRTGDHYKRAVLNPNTFNINALTNTSASNYATTSHELRDLLNNSDTDKYKTVSSATDSTVLSILGTTNTNEPVLRNPYTNYAYADGAYFKEDYDPGALISIFEQIILDNMEVREYIHSFTESTDLRIEDTIGAGMKINGAPILRFSGVNYAPSSVVTNGNSTTYTYSGMVRASHYAEQTNLQSIKVTVSGTPGTDQKILWDIPGELVPEFTHSKSSDFYYWEDPARLIFKVGLTDESKAAVEGLTNGQSKTFYTNSLTDVSNGVFSPSENNPFYQIDRTIAISKTENTTDTRADSFDRSQTTGNVIVTDLHGNNGKLVFTAKIPDVDNAPKHSKWIDALRDGVDNPDTDLDNKSGTDLTDLYRLYLNIDPQSLHEPVDLLFVIENTSGNSGMSADVYSAVTAYIPRFLKLNPENKVAAAGFNQNGSTLLSWTSTAGTVSKSTNNSDRNYVAGLKQAVTLLNDSSVANDGHRKVMVFISKNTPNYAYRSLTENTPSTYNVQSRTNTAITSFKNQFSDLTILTVGTNGANDYLNSLSSPRSTLSTANSLKEIDETVTGGLGHYRNLVIRDYLSDYVDFFNDDLDLIVRQIPAGSTNGQGTILYQNGAVTAAGQGIIESVTVDRTAKSVVVKFVPTYEKEGGVGFSLSYNVKATEKAYADYRTNFFAQRDLYGEVKGDPGTDYPYNGNATSSEKSGFHSNNRAYLIYTHHHEDSESDPVTVPYDHPVIQVGTTERKVVKSWSDGNDRHADKSVSIRLYATHDGITEFIRAAELNAENNWESVFTGLPKNVEYSVVEDPVPYGYDVSYEFDSATNTFRVTNTLKHLSITVRKVDQNGNVIAVSGVGFEVFSDSALTNSIGIYETDVNGLCTFGEFDALETYWIKEISAPAGYTPLPGPVSFTLSFDGVSSVSDELFLYVTDDGVLNVRNTIGAELPSTGGHGKLPFMTFGFLLTAGAGMYGYHEKRKDEKRRKES